MRRTTLAVLLALALVPFASTAAAPTAEACMNGVRVQTDNPTQLLVKAEKNLQSGHLDAAYKGATRVVDSLNHQKLSAKDRGALDKARRLQAVAVIRAEGKLKTRNIGVDAAAALLRSRYDHASDEATTIAEHAEALALTPSGRNDALALLADLEARDLLASPYAWRTLARLRAASGDTDGATRALERCRKSTRTASLCAVDPPDAT